MKNIYDLYDISRGVRLTKKNQTTGKIPLVTAGIQNHGIKGYISNGLSKIYSHVITIDMFGNVEYRNYQFYCDDNVIVLEPKNQTTIQEMLYNASILQKQTNGKYDYGRQCRLKNIEYLMAYTNEEIPSWVNETLIPNFDYIKESKSQKKVDLPDFKMWKSFSYDEIFNLTRGQGGKASDAKNNPGLNCYVGASDINNGITQYTSLKPTEKRNSITVANNGSVGAAFYQPIDFLASSDVTILTLKDRELNPQIALFLCTLIRQESNKVNYGRKWGISRMRESTILLPINKEDEPDWRLMEDYINSLPYSATL